MKTAMAVKTKRKRLKMMNNNYSDLLVTTEKMKKIEKYCADNGLGYYEMMHNAGTNAAKEIIKTCIQENISDKSILFIAGKGNNGGDCFVSADYLAKNGFCVSVFMVQSPAPQTECAKKAFAQMAKNKNINIFNDFSGSSFDSKKLLSLIDKNKIIADGVFGTGFHGNLPDDIKKIFSHINLFSHDKIKIAYDIPSGGNGTNGTASHDTFCADCTITFGYAKTGLYQYPLHDYCGRIVTAGIGINDNQTVYNDCNINFRLIKKAMIPKRKPDSNKGDFGRLLCITGSAAMPGACLMSTKAALRSGAGLVTAATAAQNIPTLYPSAPEAVFAGLETDENGFIAFSKKNISVLSDKIKSSSAVLIGCGIGVTEDTKKLTEWVIENTHCPLIIDADGLNCIAGCIDIIKDCKAPVILTPHPGEMARLIKKDTSYIQETRIDTAVSFCEKYENCVLVLKGAGTITAVKKDRTDAVINTTGNAGMSRGGSGDVLAGIIAGFAAKNKSCSRTADAVLIHGTAGDIAAEKYTAEAMLPTDIISMIPEAMKSLGIR